jgi:hypothetical protein
VETNLNDKIVLIVFDGKLFLGRARLAENNNIDNGEPVAVEVENVIELIPVYMNDKFEYVPNLLGNALQLPEDCMIVEVAKNSKFYTSYFDITSGLVTPLKD